MKLKTEQEKNAPGTKGIGPDYDIIKIIAFASIIIILSIILVGTIVYIITKNEVVNKLKNRDLVSIAESISYRIDSRIERAKEVSLVMANDPQIIEWVSSGESDPLQKDYAIQKINNLVSLVTQFDYSNSFIVSATTNHYWDEKGNIIDTLSESDPDDDWFFNTLSAGERVSVSFDYNEDRKGTFVFVNALIGETSSPLGVTGVGLGLQGLSREFQEFKYGNQSDLWLVDPQGEIYLSDKVEYNGKNIDELLPKEASINVIKHMNGRNIKQYALEYRSTNQGLTDLIVHPLSSTRWSILFQIPRDESIGFLNTIKLNTLFASIIVLFSITFFFYFVSHRLVNPYKKAIELNQELEEKVLERTQELQEKNAKITDSIEYAQRIQQSILPPDDTLKRIFWDYFLIWQPTDTVGGDFYWVKEFDDGFFVAIGDCTGHGVPGALMSMISVSILNQVVKDTKDTPSSILKKLNLLVKQTLKQESGDSLTDDGLDMGLCFIDKENNITFAGARASLYIKNDRDLRLIKGDKQSLGYTRTNPDYSFTDTIMNVNSNDMFYMTTDGYIDQNGGPKGYSFGKTKFMQIIDDCYQKPLSEQRKIFLQAIHDYMGNEPQRDDITVMGFKIFKE